MVTELLPNVISKRLAWKVGVLEPGVSSVPGISLRPPSPIRHTYTDAEALRESVTSDGREEAPEDGRLTLRWEVAAWPPLVEAVLPECLAEPFPPPLSNPTISSRITSPTTPTTTR
jgi:hypothetical protein